MPKPKHIHRSDFSAPINKNLISIQWLLDMPIYCHSNRNCPGGTGIVGWVRITHGPHSSVSINTPLFQKCTCTLDAQLKIIYVELGLTLWSVLSLEISCSAAQCLQKSSAFPLELNSPVMKVPNIHKEFSPAIVLSFTKSIGPILKSPVVEDMK